MMRLDPKREPHWLDLGHGVRVQVRPCTTALVMAAGAAVARGVNAESDEQAAGTLTAAFAKTLARAEWHFGGRAASCDGCARQGRPCALGAPGALQLRLSPHSGSASFWAMISGRSPSYYPPARPACSRR